MLDKEIVRRYNKALEARNQLRVLHLTGLLIFAFVAFALGLYILHPETPMSDSIITGGVLGLNVFAAVHCWRRL